MPFCRAHRAISTLHTFMWNWQKSLALKPFKNVIFFPADKSLEKIKSRSERWHLTRKIFNFASASTNFFSFQRGGIARTTPWWMGWGGLCHGPDVPVQKRGTYQEEHFAVRLDLVFLHVLYEATVGVPARTQQSRITVNTHTFFS